MSSEFRCCITEAGYTLKITGVGASFQNRIVEWPHRTLADMLRTMLTGAHLTSDYWSHTIRHAVYIQNRLPDRFLPNYINPYQRYTNRIPDLSHVRIFGSRFTAKQPRVRCYKIDPGHTTTGMFFVLWQPTLNFFWRWHNWWDKICKAYNFWWGIIIFR